MKKRRFPIVAIVVGVLFALGALGVVYGNWSETLTINGTVQTTEINAQWFANAPTKGCGDNETKNVGSTSHSLVQPVGNKSNKVIISGTNTYPGYLANCTVFLKNNGKLPVRVGGVEFKSVGKDGASDLTGCVPQLNQDPVDNHFTNGFIGCDQLSIEIFNGDNQIEQGEVDAFIIELQVLKGADQGQNLSFQLQFCVEPAIASNQCKTKAVN